MAVFKKSTTEPFRVPALTEVSADYAALIEKQTELLARQATVSAERRDLERQIAQAPAPAFRPAVAELLGEPSDSSSNLRAKVREIAALENDIAAALQVLKGRITTARSGASKLVCDATRQEYARRVAAICTALEAVAAARAQYDALRDEFDRQDVAWASLGPVSLNFLGEARDGHIYRFIREAKEAGYVN